MIDYELYEIKNSIGNEYYYCSSNFDIIYNNKTYIAKAINRFSIEQDNFKKDTLTLNASMFLNPFPEFFNLTTKDLYTIKIINSKFKIIFFGTITSVEFEVDNDIATITCSNITKLLEASIPKKRFTNSCNNDLYDNDCRLNRELYKTILDNTKFTIVDSRTITLEIDNQNQNQNSFFSNGIIIINNQRNMIMKDTYDSNTNKHTFKLFYNIIDKTEDILEIKFYQGCDKSYNTCKSKFNNNENFNGFPSIPNENLFMKFNL